MPTTPSRRNSVPDAGSSSPAASAAGGELRKAEVRLGEITAQEAQLLEACDTSQKSVRALARLRSERDLLESSLPRLRERAEAERKAARGTQAAERVRKLVRLVRQLDSRQSAALKEAFDARDEFLRRVEALSAPQRAQLAEAVVRAECRRHGLDEPELPALRVGPEFQALYDVSHSLRAIAEGEAGRLAVAHSLWRIKDPDEYERRLSEVLEALDD